MRVAIDKEDSTTAYVDLRPDELWTEEKKERAMEKAKKLGAKYVEVFRILDTGAPAEKVCVLKL